MFKRLLTFFALAAIAVGAGATIVDGVRQAPEPTTMAYSSGTECYLWNIAEKMFHSDTHTMYGNNDVKWGTRAVVFNQGIKCKFTDSGSNVVFSNFAVAKNGWFTPKIQDNGYDIFVDGSANGTNADWSLVSQGNNVYRIAQAANAAKYYGAQGRNDGFTYADCNTSKNIDWAFVAASDYDAYQSALTIYKAAQRLKVFIDSAPDGAEKTSAAAVYANESSTIEQINAAIDALKPVMFNSKITFTAGLRDIPAPTATAYAKGTKVYLFNTVGMGFHSDTHTLFGNDNTDYGTRAVLAPQGILSWFDGELGAETYFQDHAAKNGDHYAFVSDNAGNVYVDGASDKANVKWTVSAVAGKTNVYHIVNNSFSDSFYGQDAAADGNYTYGNKPATADAIEWTIVSQSDYDVWQTIDGPTLIAIYKAAAKLKAKIDEAKALGVETTAAETAYANAASTEAQLNAAFDALVQAIAERATVSHPSDLTAKLTNPDFSNGNTGWTNPGGIGNGVMESYNSGNFDINQTVANLKAGIYALELNGMYRPGDIDAAYVAAPVNKVKIYAGQTEQDIINIFNGASTSSVASGEANKFGLYFPNHLADAAAYFGEGHNLYHNKLFFALAEAGDVAIGVKKAAKYTNDWCAFDNFKLIYYGQACAEAYQLWSQNVKAMAPDYAGAKALASLLSAYTAAKATADASDEAGVQAIVAAIAAAKEPLEANIAVYRNIKVQADKLQAAIAASSAKQSVKDDAAACKAQIDAYYAAEAEATEAAQAKLNTFVPQVEKLVFLLGIDDVTASDDAPADLTNKIANPTFDDGNNKNSIAGWQGTTGYNFGNDDDQKAALALEFYHRNFNMYQELVVNNGVYKLSLNSFQRNDDGQAASSYLYATSGDRTERQAVMHITAGAVETKPEGHGAVVETSAGSGLWRPNDMVSSVYYFTQLGQYLNDVYIKVTDNRLRIGITSTSGHDWVIMDNFALTYYGENSVNDPDRLQTVVIGDAGYATFVAKTDESIADNNVYTVAVAGGRVHLTKLAANTVVPQGTPLLIEHAPGNVVLRGSNDAPATITGNELVAATADVAADGTQYCLAKLNGGVAFLKVQAGVVIPAGKAYLQVQASGAKEYYMLGDEADAIETVGAKAEADGQAIYTLQGVRVANPTKGIYVRGGKKVVIK